MVSDLYPRDLELQGLMGAGSYIIYTHCLVLLSSQCSETLAWVTGGCYGRGGVTLKFGTGLKVNLAGRLLFKSLASCQ